MAIKCRKLSFSWSCTLLILSKTVFIDVFIWLFLMDSDTKSDEEECLYFHVENVSMKDLVDFSNPPSPSGHFCRGRVVDVNGKKIALLKYQGKVFAMDEKCPHMGGPLHLGDIETLGEARLPCIVCPWHNWKFWLDNGSLKHPIHDDLIKLTLYPVRVHDDGTILVGFKSIDKNCFHATDF